MLMQREVAHAVCQHPVLSVQLPQLMQRQCWYDGKEGAKLANQGRLAEGDISPALQTRRHATRFALRSTASRSMARRSIHLANPALRVW